MLHCILPSGYLYLLKILGGRELSGIVAKISVEWMCIIVRISEM